MLAAGYYFSENPIVILIGLLMWPDRLRMTNI